MNGPYLDRLEPMLVKMTVIQAGTERVVRILIPNSLGLPEALLQAGIEFSMTSTLRFSCDITDPLNYVVTITPMEQEQVPERETTTSHKRDHSPSNDGAGKRDHSPSNDGAGKRARN